MQINIKNPNKPKAQGFLEGQFLIAMPGMEDPRFTRTVIYLCSHTEQGAMGIVINRPAEDFDFSDLLLQLEVIPEDSPMLLSEHLDQIDVMIGGPVETGRGFILHSPDYHLANSTMAIDETISLTATVDILKALVTGNGPEKALLALGYAGWGPGQLEAEIQANGWLTCPASADILFQVGVDLRYEVALSRLGVSLSQLSSVAGRA